MFIFPRQDLSASGVIITPFFIQRAGRTFDSSKFWDVGSWFHRCNDTHIYSINKHILPREDFDEDSVDEPRPDIITEMESLVQEMRIRELPKRAVFSIPLHLAEDFTIGIKGYLSKVLYLYAIIKTR